MSAIEHLTISLPTAIADRVRARVRSGDYADADEMVLEALQALDRRDDRHSGVDVDKWLRSVVAGTVRANDDDPARLMTVDAVRDRLEIARARRSA